MGDVFLTMPWISFENNRIVMGLGSLCSDSNLSVISSLPELQISSERDEVINIDKTTVININFNLPIFTEPYENEVSKEVLGSSSLTEQSRISKKYGDLRPLLCLLYLYKQVNK